MDFVGMGTGYSRGQYTVNLPRWARDLRHRAGSEIVGLCACHTAAGAEGRVERLPLSWAEAVPPIIVQAESSPAWLGVTELLTLPPEVLSTS
jgi:hypothetical protein